MKNKFDINTKWYRYIWWWIGYHGPYQINWWLKKKYGNLYMHDRTLWKKIKVTIKKKLKII